jgi:hypothetical protein
MDQWMCQNQVDGLAVFVEQGCDLKQWNVLVVQNGCTKMQFDVKGNLGEVKTTFVCMCIGA